MMFMFMYSWKSTWTAKKQFHLVFQHPRHFGASCAPVSRISDEKEEDGCCRHGGSNG